MLEGLFSGINQVVLTSPWLAPLAAFLGGMLTASNPCVLVMIPLIVGYVAGNAETRSLKKALAFSLLFVIGIGITFTGLGVLAALSGRLLGDIGAYWKYIVGLVALLMGIHLLGFIHFNFSIPLRLKTAKTGWLSSILLGMLFGIVSTPCAVPLLVLLLTYVAAKGSSLVFGGLLLLMYALGHSVLVLIAGTSMGAARRLLEGHDAERTTKLLRRIGGILVLLAGAYFLLF